MREFLSAGSPTDTDGDRIGPLAAQVAGMDSSSVGKPYQNAISWRTQRSNDSSEAIRQLVVRGPAQFG
jgi:hypothetical protein